MNKAVDIKRIFYIWRF